MWLYDKNILDKIHVTVSNILKLMQILLLINFTFIKTRLLGEHVHVDQATRQFSCTCISSRFPKGNSVCRNVAFVLSLSVYIRIYMSTTLVLWTVECVCCPIPSQLRQPLNGNLQRSSVPIQFTWCNIQNCLAGKNLLLWILLQ